MPLENVKPKHAQILCYYDDKVVKGKIYGISKMDADCFFTDESTSFAFFFASR